MADAYVGLPLSRVDGRAKVTGAARYTADFFPEGALHAVAFCSEIARGRIVEIDAAAAWKMAGVVSILTHENMPRLQPVDADGENGTPGQEFLPMQSDIVQHAGQHIGLVIANTLDRARAAALTIKVRYEEKQPWLWNAAGNESSGRAYRPKEVGRGDPADSSRGDAATALQSAAITLRERYYLPQENHNPMELSATVAAWQGDDQLTLYTTTQHIYGSRHVIARALGLKDEQVRVICPFVGGAFGCKGSTWPHEFITAAAAKVVGRPVKFVVTRQQMFTSVGCRPEIANKIALGADSAGKLEAILHDSCNHTAATDEWAEPTAKQTRMLYSCKNVKTTHRVVPVHRGNPTQMRAPGHAPGTWALEVAMDELAWKAGVDPIELRLRNHAERDEDLDLDYTSKSLRECYREGARRFGWDRYVQKVGAFREGKTLIGWGMATATYPTNRAPAEVNVRLLPDGSAVVTSATHDLGTGTYTIMTQIAAETLGLPIENVSFLLGDSQMPKSPVSGGSQSAASTGSAVRAACINAREKLVAEAGVSAGEAIAEVLRRHGKILEASGKTEPPDKKKYSTHAFGAQFAEVRVDPDLGEVRLSRVVAAFAAGRILNEKTAKSQLMGGIVMGVGMALLEQTAYDPRREKPVTDNLADYLVPVNPDIPPIEILLVAEHDTRINELRAKGVGELGTTGIAAAVTNAVYHATGKRVRDLPITLDKLL